MKPKTAFRHKKQALKPGFKFKDIIFHSHHIEGGVQACVEFENGHWASIVGCPWDTLLGYAQLYGDGVNNFEILSSITDKPGKYTDVKSWQTKKQVMGHLKYMERL